MDIRKVRTENGTRAVALGRKVLEGPALGRERPSRLLFITVSGAHIYGFPSDDSDIDLRGAHVLPARQVLGLLPCSETFEAMDSMVDGVPVDCVTHDIGKYLRLLVKKNGYILEQICSPLVVHDDGSLGRLRQLAMGALTRHVVHHYKGFFRSREQLVLASDRPEVKAALYLFRVVMTGLHLLRTREVETDILQLNDQVFHLPFIDELVERKMTGSEHGVLGAGERDRLLVDAGRLQAELDPAAERSGLPEVPGNMDELNDFLVATRLQEDA